LRFLTSRLFRNLIARPLGRQKWFSRFKQVTSSNKPGDNASNNNHQGEFDNNAWFETQIFRQFDAANVHRDTHTLLHFPVISVSFPCCIMDSESTIHYFLPFQCPCCLLVSGFACKFCLTFTNKEANGYRNYVPSRTK